MSSNDALIDSDHETACAKIYSNRNVFNEERNFYQYLYHGNCNEDFSETTLKLRRKHSQEKSFPFNLFKKIVGFSQEEINQIKVEKENYDLLYALIKTASDKFPLNLKEKILAFSEDLKKNCPQTCNGSLSELIYLLDHAPHEIPKIIDLPLEHAVIFLEMAFSEKIIAIKVKLENEYQKNENYPLQNKDLIKAFHTVKEVSNILLTLDGKFNFGLIPKLIKFFTDEKNLNYSYNLKYGLQQLQHSLSLREKIDQLLLPTENVELVNEVVSTSLQLSPNTSITERHIRQCALSALLFHHRQGKSGSCFASFLAIELQNMNLEQMLNDLSELLSKGKIQKKIHDVEKDFYFLFKMSDFNDQGDIYLDKEGHILSSGQIKGYVWDAPIVKQICKYFNKTNSKEDIINFIEKNNSQNTIAVSFPQFFTQALQITSSQASIIFNSQTHHPLLQVWENTLASMSEGEGESLLKAALNKTFIYLLTKYGFKNQVQKDKILKKISEKIDQRAEYLYDPSFKNEFETTEGAFLLFDNQNKNQVSLWTPINSPETFKAFLNSIILETLNEYEIEDIETLDKCSSDSFLIEFLRKYHKENTLNNTHQGLFTEARYKPWNTVIGNDPKMVMKVYYENLKIPQTETLEPANAKQLIESIINQLTKLPSGLKKKYSQGNYSFIPLRIAKKHAFSLNASHPSMKAIYEPSFNAEHWLEYKIQCGEEIANLPTSSMIREKLTYFLLKTMPKEYKYELAEKLQDAPTKINIKDFRNYLIQTFKSCINEPVQEIEKQLDLEIIKSLPKNVKKRWEDTVIAFADTNWQIGIHDIYYAVAVNPGTGEFELMSVLDDGSIFEFLNQNQFLKNHIWELGKEMS